MISPISAYPDKQLHKGGLLSRFVPVRGQLKQFVVVNEQVAQLAEHSSEKIIKKKKYQLSPDFLFCKKIFSSSISKKNSLIVKLFSQPTLTILQA